MALGLLKHQTVLELHLAINEKNQRYYTQHTLGKCSLHGATVHLFADANPPFALTPEPTNQPTVA